MDAFRLLSRSTNLSRKGSSRSRLSGVIPSAGEASNPQLFGEQDITSSAIVENNNVPRGQKRKRREAQPTSWVPKELDFLESASAAKIDHTDHSSRSAIRDAPTERLAANATKGSNNVPQDGQILPEEECRRILNVHKVKITQLWTPQSSPPQADNSKAERKKRKRETLKVTDVDNSKKRKKQKLALVPQPLQHFGELRSRYNVSRQLAENVIAQGYTVPTEVQLGSLPLLLGDNAPVSGGTARLSIIKKHDIADAPEAADIGIDLLTVAPTGSGKTLAFLIPILNSIGKQRAANRTAGHVEQHASEPKAFIIAPTKELASQIVNEAKKLCIRTGIRVSLVRKGMAISGRISDEPTLAVDQQEEAASDDEERPKAPQNPNAVTSDVLVSTPLNLLHAMTAADSSISRLSSGRYLVLDEADVLLDELFREQTVEIWSALTNPLLRVSLWSATMGASIEDLAQSTIAQRWATLPTNETETTERAPLVRLVVGLKDSAIPNIQHKLVYAATEQGKLMALRQLLRPAAPVAGDMPILRPPFLVFVQTIPRAIALHSELLYDIPQEAGGSLRIAVLHADLTDTARESVMTRFRKGEIWVLITTDLLSRGVDFRGVNGVVNYDFPGSSAAYVHRVGRTGRAGREGGVAITLYAKDDIPFVKNVANVIAAAERQKGTTGSSEGLQQWLLDAMPTPSKRDKQQLKKRGVESRRSGKAVGKDGKPVGRSKISTKSGYERRLENNRRGAVKGGQQRVIRNGLTTTAHDDEDDFSGFDD